MHHKCPDQSVFLFVLECLFGGVGFGATIFLLFQQTKYKRTDMAIVFDNQDVVLEIFRYPVMIPVKGVVLIPFHNPTPFAPCGVNLQ